MSIKMLKKEDYVFKKVSELIPYADNPRDHENSLPELIKSIKEVGFYQPMIIDQKNRIVCGHGRKKACEELDIEEVPCIVWQLTDAQYLIVMLSDNKITELTKYTNKTLKAVLRIMGALEHTPVGFTECEIAKLFGHTVPVKVVTDEDNAKLIKRKIFQFTESQHEEITGKLKLFIKEHELENEAQAILMMLKKYKGPAKTEIKAGPVKVTH